MSASPTPAPNLTTAELAHFHSLVALSHACDTAIEDPATPSDARDNQLLPLSTRVSEEITAMNELALHRDTFDLAAEKQALDPALQAIQTLRAELARYVHATNSILTVATVADGVLSTGTALGLDI